MQEAIAETDHMFTYSTNFSRIRSSLKMTGIDGLTKTPVCAAIRLKSGA